MAKKKSSKKSGRASTNKRIGSDKTSDKGTGKGKGTPANGTALNPRLEPLELMSDWYKWLTAEKYPRLLRLPPRQTGTSPSGLIPGASCPHKHYLGDGEGEPNDRLRWWERWFVAQGDASQTGAITMEFQCEFDTALTTIVGARLDRLAGVGYRVLPWDKAPLEWSQGVPGIHVDAHVRRPGSVPRLREDGWHIIGTEDGASEEEDAPVRVLFNSSNPGATFTPTELDAREPMEFLFDEGQRAVGLEFGYDAQGGAEEPRGQAVTMTAYAADGTRIASATALECKSSQNKLDEGVIEHRIGVRDVSGRIRRVRLHFGATEDSPGTQRQVVFRIWHEALPCAAVRQVRLQSPAPPNSGDFPLPFHHDRAVAFLRGFKIASSDSEEHEFSRLAIWLSEKEFRGDIHGLEAVVHMNGEDVPGATGFAYVTLLSWDSNRADLHPARVDTENQHSRFPFNGAGMPFMDRMVADPGTEGRLEGLTATLSGFELVWSEDQGDLEWLSIALNTEQQPFLAGEDVPPVFVLQVLPNRTTQPHSIWWSFDLSAEGDDPPNHRWAGGVILAGASITRGSLTIPGEDTEFPPAGLRSGENGGLLLSAERVDNMGLGFRLDAEMATLGLNHAVLRPEDEVREIDVEVRGVSYDGVSMRWELRGGLATDSGDADDAGEGLVEGVPFVVGINPNSRVLLPAVNVQQLVARYVPQQSILFAPLQGGVFRNAGRGPLWVTGISARGPHVSQFTFYIMVNGQPRLLSQVVPMLPIRLMPHETIYVWASVASNTGGVRLAELVFQTNVEGRAEIPMMVTGVQ